VFGVVVGLMEKFAVADGSLAGAKVYCPGGSAFTIKVPVESVAEIQSCTRPDSVLPETTTR
jgi:hypothetical protein